MRRKTIVAIVLCFALSYFKAEAQSYFTPYEVGIAFGGSQYFGDLNDNRSLSTIAPAMGVYFRRHMNGYISLKAVANFTHVSYDDKYNSSAYQQMRNLNFQSDVWEVAVQSEFNFFKFITGDPNYRFTVFLTGGVGAFYYNPYTIYNGRKYDLKPLGTEGQYVGYADRKYNNISACFPLGVGLKCWLKGGINLTLEIADRLTLTDYLDDVSTTYVGANKFNPTSINYKLQDRSTELEPNNPALGRPGKQRGNTASYDQYLMAVLSLSWHFTTYRCPAGLTEELIRVK